MGGLFLVSAISLIVGYNVWTHRHMTWLRFHYFRVTLPSEDLGIEPYYALFHNLDEELQRRFRWRAFYFLNTTTIKFKQFHGYSRRDKEKVRHLLASVAAQMTLFLPEKCFLMIHTILVYPEAYYSRFSKKYHKGETNPAAGMIALSWTGIAEGIKSPVDGLNLIIHEYAHALWLEHASAKYQTFDPESADRFQEIATKELAEAAGKEDHFFRNYGLTNFHEFFAVAAENFFERPLEFEKRLPHIYKAMTELYQQDPNRIILPQG